MVDFRAVDPMVRPTPRAGNSRASAVPMQLAELARIVPAATVRGDANVSVSDATADSRTRTGAIA